MFLESVRALLMTSGKLFQIKHPEYLMLCLKHSVRGFGGTKHPVVIILGLQMYLNYCASWNFHLYISWSKILIHFEHKFGLPQKQTIINRLYI